MSVARDVLTRPWPLTGRHEDLDAVCAAIEEGCPAFFVLGEAGSGKTRLAREVLRRLDDDGWLTARATATESAQGTPLGALAHLVPAGSLDSPATLFHATQTALLERLAERGDDRPLVLHLDDAHHLDPSSASLLVSLTEAGSVRLLITMRSGLRVPEAIAALRAGDEAQSLTLGSLDAIAIDTLLHRVLGGPLDGVAEAQLLHTSGGNPLYLRELVLGAVADGTLTEVSGVWRLSGTFSTTEALGERVLGRMSTLAEASRDALNLIAVGEPIGLDLLETMVDPVVLEDLERRVLIRIDQEQRRNQVLLAHPVYGEILRTSLGRMQRRRLSRLHAEAITALGARRRDDAVRVVRWQIDAGITPDLDVVLSGSRLARHNQDWVTVASLSRAAVDAGAVDAASLLAEAHFELGELDETLAAVKIGLADPNAISEESLAQLHRTSAMCSMWGFDDADAALAELIDAHAMVTDPALQELFVFSQASVLAWCGRIAEAQELVTPLLDSGEPRVAVQAAQILELITATAGPAGRAIELADTWFPVHLELPDLAGTSDPGNHLLTKTVALTHAGRLSDAAELAEFGYGVSVGNRSLIGQMWFSLELGRIALMRGDAVTSRRWFREQIALCRGTGHRRPVTLGHSGLAIAEAHLGNAAAAAEAIEELEQQPSAVIELFAIERARGGAWAKAASGDPAGARAELIAGAEAAEAMGVTLMAGLARFDALRLGDTKQGPAIAAAAAVSDSRILTAAARWAASPNDGAELAAVAAEFEEMGALMFAAEAFAAASVAWRKAGEQRRSAADEQRADELARKCRGASTPALTTESSVVPLTAREREIAVLVADGLSSKEVAERLYLSARTVSNHLQNAYAKLGITKRAELASALNRLGAAPEVQP